MGGGGKGLGPRCCCRLRVRTRRSIKGTRVLCIERQYGTKGMYTGVLVVVRQVGQGLLGMESIRRLEQVGTTCFIIWVCLFCGRLGRDEHWLARPWIYGVGLRRSTIGSVIMVGTASGRSVAYMCGCNWEGMRFSFACLPAGCFCTIVDRFFSAVGHWMLPRRLPSTLAASLSKSRGQVSISACSGAYVRAEIFGSARWLWVCCGCGKGAGDDGWTGG